MRSRRSRVGSARAACTVLADSRNTPGQYHRFGQLDVADRKHVSKPTECFADAAHRVGCLLEQAPRAWLDTPSTFQHFPHS